MSFLDRKDTNAPFAEDLVDVLPFMAGIGCASTPDVEGGKA